MASTFHIFRRNQKLMLAILTLMAMFAFVFLDPMFRYLGGQQAPSNPLVAETRYGELRRSDLENLQATRGMVAGFLKMLASTTVKKLKDQGLLDLRSPGVEEYYNQQLQNQFLGRVMRSTRPTDPHAALDTMLLARRAFAMKIVVSDSAINAVLKQLTMNSVTPAEIVKIIHGMKGGSGGQLSDGQLFDALRTELAASGLAQSFAVSINATPPGESWDYYKRLNQKARIEAIALNIADFADRVTEPSDEDLKAFFDKHKDQIAIPGSPEPGFKLPRRQQFQYFLAEFDLFRERAKVTDEEIEQYYQQNKESFRKLELPKEKPPAGNEDPPKTGDEKSQVPPSDEEPAATEKSESDAPTTEKPPAEPNQDATSEKCTGEQPAEETPATETPATETPATETPATETPATETPATETPATETPAAETPATGKPAAETPANEEAYDSLEKVREEIISTLKRQAAEKKIREALDELTSRLGAYSDARTIYELKKNDPSAKPPKEPDFVLLARQYDLSFEETKLVSYFELNSGKKLGSSRSGNVPFAVLAFRNTQLSPYRPVVSEDNAGNRYLSWKVDDQPEQIPSFEDDRAEVLKTWKLIQARDLVLKQAETDAARAQGAKKSLSEVFTGEQASKVITAGPFSWMTLGTTADNAAGGLPMLSEVVGIESPSMEFMQTTFGLAQGEVGVAMNGPRNICYVVQVTQYDPPLDELEADFARENFRNYLNVAVREKQGLMQSWLAAVERDADLKWIEEPATQE